MNKFIFSPKEEFYAMNLTLIEKYNMTELEAGCFLIVNMKEWIFELNELLIDLFTEKELKNELMESAREKLKKKKLKTCDSCSFNSECGNSEEVKEKAEFCVHYKNKK